MSEHLYRCYEIKHKGYFISKIVTLIHDNRKQKERKTLCRWEVQTVMQLCHDEISYIFSSSLDLKNTFFPVLYLSIRKKSFSRLFCKLLKQIIECFWILSYTFFGTSIVIWIWRSCMRQVISLNQNCKTKVGYILACLKPIKVIRHYKISK